METPNTDNYCISNFIRTSTRRKKGGNEEEEGEGKWAGLGARRARQKSREEANWSMVPWEKGSDDIEDDHFLIH